MSEPLPEDNLCTWCKRPMTGHPMISCLGEVWGPPVDRPLCMSPECIKAKHTLAGCVGVAPDT